MALEIGLCMTVKDEADNIVACLDPIIDLFAKVVIIDTGSSDETPTILRERFGLRPAMMPLSEERCFALADARNWGFDQLDTTWLVTLDADERIDRRALTGLASLNDNELPGGIFCAWDTRVDHETVIPDYKLWMFRNQHRHWGHVHDTAQPSLRFGGDTACWYPDLRLDHLPDPRRAEYKRIFYERRLDCAMRLDPDWLRYAWFKGHNAYKRGDIAIALASLQPLHDKRPPLFPVESLYASMLLASIHAQEGNARLCEEVLADALGFHARVAGDFEVVVNGPVISWLHQARDLAAQRDLADLTPLAFPY